MVVHVRARSGPAVGSWCRPALSVARGPSPPARLIAEHSAPANARAWRGANAQGTASAGARTLLIASALPRFRQISATLQAAFSLLSAIPVRVPAIFDDRTRSGLQESSVVATLRDGGIPDACRTCIPPLALRTRCGATAELVARARPTQRRAQWLQGT